MQIILKGCTQDVIDEIGERLGSLSILDCECTDIFDEPIYQIEIDTTKCNLVTQSEWINIIRRDVKPERIITIADFRFEEAIIK